MKTKTITLYDYSELSPEAKKRALSKWNETNDDPYMQSDMINRLKEKLDARGIKYDTDSIDVRYSLSYCQGDGFMFEGVFTWRGKEIKVKHDCSRYYHKHTADFFYDDNELSDDEVVQFQAVYDALCKEMEQEGYEEIEYQQSEESFMNACEANGYTFREDGTMENE